jgi:hypothetical protein
MPKWAFVKFMWHLVDWLFLFHGLCWLVVFVLDHGLNFVPIGTSHRLPPPCSHFTWRLVFCSLHASVVRGFFSTLQHPPLPWQNNKNNPGFNGVRFSSWNCFKLGGLRRYLCVCICCRTAFLKTQVQSSGDLRSVTRWRGLGKQGQRSRNGQQHRWTAITRCQTGSVTAHPGWSDWFWSQSLSGS